MHHGSCDGNLVYIFLWFSCMHARRYVCGCLVKKLYAWLYLVYVVHCIHQRRNDRATVSMRSNNECLTKLPSRSRKKISKHGIKRIHCALRKKKNPHKKFMVGALPLKLACLTFIFTWAKWRKKNVHFFLTPLFSITWLWCIPSALNILIVFSWFLIIIQRSKTKIMQ